MLDGTSTTDKNLKQYTKAQNYNRWNDHKGLKGKMGRFFLAIRSYVTQLSHISQPLIYLLTKWVKRSIDVWKAMKGLK